MVYGYINVQLIGLIDAISVAAFNPVHCNEFPFNRFFGFNILMILMIALVLQSSDNTKP